MLKDAKTAKLWPLHGYIKQAQGRFLNYVKDGRRIHFSYVYFSGLAVAVIDEV